MGPDPNGKIEPKKLVVDLTSTKLQNWKELFEFLQVIVTIGAIIIGGWWTYTNFIQGRENYPHLNIKQRISHVIFNDERNLVIVDVELENIGNRKVNLITGDIRVQQILPIISCEKVTPCVDEEMKDALKARSMEKIDRFSWPLIMRRKKSYSNNLIIEPGELDKINFEFVIPSKVRVIRVYTYFENIELSKGKKKIGWKISNYYDFKEN